MFESIQNFINGFISGLSENIVIESETVYGKEKLEYSLLKQDYRCSISILSNYTYDFFILDNEIGNMFMIKTLYFDIIENLLKQIEQDLIIFSEIKK